MWLLVYKNFINSYFQQRFSIIGGDEWQREERCLMCGKATESVPHILAGCGALAQSLYLARHNNALKILFFQVIRALDLVTPEIPWFSKTQPKPMYENERAIGYWDIPLYADNTHVKANRIDATIVDKENKKVSVIEMSCPWVEKREEKDAEKTTTTLFFKCFHRDEKKF